MKACRSLSLDDLNRRRYPAAFQLCSGVAAGFLKIMAHAGRPVMDGSSSEVMLCIPDESSGSLERIYVAVEERPREDVVCMK